MALIAVVPVALGALGVASAGPLLATVVIGRTSVVPSARWLGMCLAVWLVAGGVAAAVSGGSMRTAPRVVRALAILAPLAVVTPLLPLLYVNDAAFHVAASGGAPVALVGYSLTLLSLGALWPAAMPALPRVLTGRPSAPPQTGAASVTSRVAGATSMAVIVPLVAVLVMTGANYGVLEPLGRPGAAPLWLVINVVCLAAAAWVVGGGATGFAVAVALAWLVFGPVQTLLSSGPAGVLVLLGAASQVAIARRLWPAAAVSLGVIGGLAPPAGAALLALLCLGRVRLALIGGAIAATTWYVTSWSGAGSAVPWGAPHLSNAALAAFHARLFAGPGTLVDPSAVPAPPAVALTLGALVTGGALSLAWLASLRRAVRSDGETEATAVTLALLAGLLLGGTATHQQIALACVAAVPLAWAARAGTMPLLWLTAAVTGYALAGADVTRLARAAAEVISAWPPAASLPVAGLALLAGALIYALRARLATEPAGT